MRAGHLHLLDALAHLARADECRTLARSARRDGRPWRGWYLHARWHLANARHSLRDAKARRVFA